MPDDKSVGFDSSQRLVRGSDFASPHNLNAVMKGSAIDSQTISQTKGSMPISSVYFKQSPINKMNPGQNITTFIPITNKSQIEGIPTMN